ncbi:MAG TPA: PH domain-containing protein, partial [Candidatus Acidoferrum sp.]|nr:PH domain-containing protein [Candidatus Acidoferrum sp.]
MEFRSAVDKWHCLLLAGIAIAMLMLIYPLLNASDTDGINDAKDVLLLLLSSVLAASVPLWLLATTRYTITEDALVARIGALRWNIPLNTITSVHRTRGLMRGLIHGLMRGPALSINGIEIHYGRFNCILVSP